jgi:hypothetical protein
VDDCHFTWTSPREYIARLRHDCRSTAAGINHRQISLADFFEAGDCESTGGAITKDGDNRESLKLEFGNTCGIANQVIEML